MGLALGRASDALGDCAAAGLTGVLRVSGDPGGRIYLAGGGVTAIETPGAPGPDVILLRSRRIPERDWDAAFAAAAAAGGPLSGELTERGLVGTGELEALLRIALADAMFVLASGFADECRTEEASADCLLPLIPAAEAGWLLAETARRMQVLAAFPGPAVHGRDRVTIVPGAVPGVLLGGGRDEILALADGRRTIRDLAFALGRGVYATALQAARMQQDGLLEVVPHAPARPSADASTAAAAGDDAETPAGLPRRRRDRPANPRRAGETSGWGMPAAIRLLRPRSEGNATSSETE